MTLEEAKNIVHRILRNAHMHDKAPAKWTDRIELAHRIVREHNDELIKKHYDMLGQDKK